jgi:hypothetical protein
MITRTKSNDDNESGEEENAGYSTMVIAQVCPNIYYLYSQSGHFIDILYHNRKIQ